MIPTSTGAPIPMPTGGGSSGYSTSYLSNQSATLAAQRQTVSDPNNPLVYVGSMQQYAAAPTGRGNAADFRHREGHVKAPHLRSMSDLMLEFDHWSDDRKKKMAEKLAKAGLFSSSPYKDESLKEFVGRMTLSDVQSAYAGLLQAASARWAAGQKITPEQLLQQHIDYNQSVAGGQGIFGKNGGSGSGSGGSNSPYANKTITQTSKSVDIYDPIDARGLIRATLRRELDRDPTEAEFEDFVSALQAKQRSDPQINKQTTTYDANGTPVNQTSTTTGGMTANGIDEFATEQAQANPNWAEWQAVGTYFPAAMNALGSAVPGV